jgi:hypothetical protein
VASPQRFYPTSWGFHPSEGSTAQLFNHGERPAREPATDERPRNALTGRPPPPTGPANTVARRAPCRRDAATRQGLDDQTPPLGGTGGGLHRHVSATAARRAPPPGGRPAAPAGSRASVAPEARLPVSATSPAAASTAARRTPAAGVSAARVAAAAGVTPTVVAPTVVAPTVVARRAVRAARPPAAPAAVRRRRGPRAGRPPAVPLAAPADRGPDDQHTHDRDHRHAEEGAHLATCFPYPRSGPPWAPRPLPRLPR